MPENAEQRPDTALPLISIIMPSFNQAGFIRASMNSVLSQNYPRMELIIVDGGSTDGTVEILQKQSLPVRWVSEPDKGQADALNKAFRMATGEIIGWLNADDLYQRNALFHVGRYFAAHPETMWVAGPCSIINEKDKPIRKFITWYKTWRLRHYSYRALLSENFISQMGVFFRRKALESVGGFDVTRHYAMDYDLWLRLAKNFEPGILCEPLGCFRMYSTTKSITGFSRQFAEDLEVAKKHAKGDFWPVFFHQINHFKIVSIYYCMSLVRNLQKGSKS